MQYFAETFVFFLLLLFEQCVSVVLWHKTHVALINLATALKTYLMCVLFVCVSCNKQQVQDTVCN